MFIGRKKELDYLESRFQSNKSELIVLYGRRRIGKTELLREFSKDKDRTVFFVCTESTDQEQLSSFSSRILSVGIPAAKYLRRFEDWESAFKSVTEIPKIGKKLLIIDEFPYMCKGNSSIPSIIQKLWDSILQYENVMIILCGSSLSFMEREVLAEKNPLYGRATGIYRLGAMPFSDARQFFPNYSQEDQLTSYAILGGIPHYLKQFNPSATVAENIQREILSPGSILYNEVEFLLHQELREISVYNSIIEAIAAGATRINLIHGRTGLENTKISAYLRNLLELNIVKKEFSLLTPTKERAGSNRGLYSLTDSFFRFWYRFVYPSVSELSMGEASGIYRHLIEPKLPEFIAPAFEEICRQYLYRLNNEGALPFYFTKIGRWWENVTHDRDGKKETVAEEIDLIAQGIVNNHSQYILAECKFRRGGADIDVFEALKNKFPSNKYPGTYHYFIFSFFGYSSRLKQLAQTNDVTLVPADDIFKVL